MTAFDAPYRLDASGLIDDEHPSLGGNGEGTVSLASVVSEACARAKSTTWLSNLTGHGVRYAPIRGPLLDVCLYNARGPEGPRGCRVVNVYALVADGVNTDGHRVVVGAQVASAENDAGWLTFSWDLNARRGLVGLAERITPRI